MADLIETLTSLQEAIFLGTVAARNRMEHRRIGERNSLACRQNAGNTPFSGYPKGVRQAREMVPDVPQRKIEFSGNFTEGRKMMSDNLDVIVLEDDPLMCSLITETLKGFYTWGDIHSFTKVNAALAFCREKKLGVAIFILDVYLDTKTAFDFLYQISDQCAWASEDTVMITGNASDDIVNMCIASNITYLIEKPIKAHALKLAVRAMVEKYLRYDKRLRAEYPSQHRAQSLGFSFI